jgi:hypothetical protein
VKYLVNRFYLKGNAYRILIGKPEGRGPLGRSRHRWEGNIKIDVKCSQKSWTGFIWLRIGTVYGLL